MSERSTPRDIDEYIAGFPPDVQTLLEQVRSTIRDAAPDAEEAISYQIPTYKFHGNLVHFAAFQKHIGFYPAPRGNEDFRDELSAYKGGKGTVQFPIDKPVPVDLIRRMVQFRVQKNLERAEARRMKRQTR